MANCAPSGGDVHIAGLFVTPWVTHLIIFGAFSWKNAMGSMRMALEECHGLHGEFPGAFPGESPERISFMALGPKKAMDSESMGPWAHGPMGPMGPQGSYLTLGAVFRALGELKSPPVGSLPTG